MFRAWMTHEHWVIWIAAAIVFILALAAIGYLSAPNIFERATTGAANGAPTREHRMAKPGGAGRGSPSSDKADKGRKFPPSCDGHHSGSSQGELVHTQN